MRHSAFGHLMGNFLASISILNDSQRQFRWKLCLHCSNPRSVKLIYSKQIGQFIFSGFFASSDICLYRAIFSSSKSLRAAYSLRRSISFCCLFSFSSISRINRSLTSSSLMLTFGGSTGLSNELVLLSLSLTHWSMQLFISNSKGFGSEIDVLVATNLSKILYFWSWLMSPSDTSDGNVLNEL